MREKKVFEAVDRQLPKTVHRQSMTGAAMTSNGTPDRYYDGPGNDLWVEYKQLDHMPHDRYVRVAPIEDVKKQPKGRLTTLQLAWLTRRWDSSVTHNAIVVVGLPNKTALLLRSPSKWNDAVSIFESRTYAEVAQWIQDFCGA